MKRSRIHHQERSSLALVEEAAALLRNAPLNVHAAYLIGTFPFVVALLFFWTDMSRGAFAQQRMATGALGLAALYVWMKLWQAHHAAGLRGYLESVPAEPLTLQRGIGIAAHQGLIHGLGLFLLPLSMLLVVPFVWTYAFLQNASVYGGWDGIGLRDTLRRSWRQAAYWPLQNHYVVWMVSPLLMMLACAALLVIVPILSQSIGGLGYLFIPLLILLMVLISPISLVVALNLFVLILLVPILLRMLLGIETVFSRGLMGMLNSTTLATTAALTYLALDPLMKAVYVLRCFYAESIASGADIRSSLSRFAGFVLLCGTIVMSSPSAQADPPRQNIHAATGAGFADRATASSESVPEQFSAPAQTGWTEMRLSRRLRPTAWAPAGRANSPSEPPSDERSHRGNQRMRTETLAEPDRLDRAIDAEIQRAEYAWRLPRNAAPILDEDAWLANFMERIGTKIQSWLGLIYRKADIFRKWIEWLFPEPDPDAERGWGGGWATTLRVLFYGAILLLGVTVGVAIVRLVQTRRRPLDIDDTGSTTPIVPDLEDEEVAADALPEDEWMGLARRLLSEGDYRLAIRACFLAALAHLAQSDLVNIRAYKSNCEYLRELERRAHAHPGLPGAFRSGMDEFECVWYGNREATAARYNQVDATLQRMKQSC